MAGAHCVVVPSPDREEKLAWNPSPSGMHVIFKARLQHFYGLGPAKAIYRSFPAHIQDLKYSVESNGKERREVVILEGVSGSFAPGKMTAVVSGGHAGVTLDSVAL